MHGECCPLTFLLSYNFMLVVLVLIDAQDARCGRRSTSSSRGREGRRDGKGLVAGFKAISTPAALDGAWDNDKKAIVYKK
jgi:hypothetical protein